MPDRPIRGALDEAAFRRLCAGEVVVVPSAGGALVEIILSDIGLVPALKAVVDGMGGGHKGRGDG